MDVLSNTLMQMKLKTFVSGATDASGNWAVSFPTYEGFKLGVVVKGECWIWAEGESPRELKTGDCGLMTGGKPMAIGSHPSMKPTPYEELISTAKPDVLTLNGGGEVLLAAAHFQFEGHLGRILFENLPPVIYIPEHMEQAAILRWSLERFRAEFSGNEPGRALILNHLAPIMLLQIFRTYLASSKGDQNWLTSLSNPKLSKAIEAIHTEYGRRWSLEELAKVACMSRSGFALNFKKQIGIAPMDYLTHWRMHMAGEMLQSGERNVSDVAFAVGYESESAFSATFKKILHCRPGSYQKSQAMPSHP